MMSGPQTARYPNPTGAIKLHSLSAFHTAAGLNMGSAARFSTWALLQPSDAAASPGDAAGRSGLQDTPQHPGGGSGSSQAGAVAGGSQQRPAAGPRRQLFSGNQAQRPVGSSQQLAASSSQQPPAGLPAGVPPEDLAEPLLDSDDDVRPGDSIVLNGSGTAGGFGDGLSSQRSVQNDGAGAATGRGSCGKDGGSQIAGDAPSETTAAGKQAARALRKRRRESGQADVVDLT